MTFVSTPTAAIHQAAATTKSRIASIDIMRGLVMVVMALDHTRDYFHMNSGLFDPTDLSQTTPLLFFTRIITHYCAPTFVLLSGMSAYISKQGRTNRQLSIFLVTRGLWLIFLEFTVVRFSITFNLYYDFVLFQVIWVIGACMVVLSALVYLNRKFILTLGLVLVFGHNLFDLVPVAPGEPGYVAWAIVRQAGSVVWGEGNIVNIAYPLLPWLGIMLTGYGLGLLYDRKFDDEKRQNILMYAGIAAVGLFILIRFINAYGDPASWSIQKNDLFTVMSFVNVTKYPPSLLYTLMTIGPVLILLSWMDTLKVGTSEPLRVIGRVPLFFYVLHFFLIHITSIWMYMIITDTSWSQVDFHFNKTFGGIPIGYGYSLGWVYAAWIGIILALYPLCNWYHNYKSQHSHWWLSYL